MSGLVTSWISGRKQPQHTFAALSTAKANAKGYIYRLQRTTKKGKRHQIYLKNHPPPPDPSASLSVCDHSLFHPLPH